MDGRVVHPVTAPATFAPATRMRYECKVCWYVYDPARGDDVWQVPPDTPFAALPAHWSCPQCSTTPDQFLALPDA